MPEGTAIRSGSESAGGAALRVGITGGIGSGKSTVSALLVHSGAGLIDADAISRELTSPGGGAMNALMAAFGPSVVLTDGGLNRAVMRRRAFTDLSVKSKLEAILHPLIRAESSKRAETLAPECAYLVFDIPLLVEAGSARSRVDRKLVVDCPLAVQRERVMKRSELCLREVDEIIARQASRAERLQHADDVLFNDDDISALGTRVTLLHQTYANIATAFKVFTHYARA